MIKRFCSLLKVSSKFIYSCLKYAYSTLKFIARLTRKCLKVLAITTIIMLSAATTLMSLLPDSHVSSIQMSENLPNLVPSTKYDYKRSIVRLYVGDQFYCSGVVIGRNYVLTASHCLVDNDYRMRNEEITVVNDDGSVVVKAKSVGVNIRMDWGLIHGNFTNIPGAYVVEAGYTQETKVTACGYPQGAKILTCQELEPLMNDGFLIKCKVGPMLFPGMSGGPVFNAEGYVVGLNTLVYPQESRGGTAYSPVTGILANFKIADY